jgi:FkbM family methyltransferase
MLSWSFIREVGPIQWAVRYGTLQFRKRVLRRDSKLRLPTGLRIDLPRYSGSASEVYVTCADTDWGAEAIFARFADSARDFLDIGAHVGYYSLYLAPLVRRAYAFEPSALNLPHLYKNAERAGNVDVLEMAVTSHDGEADFFSGDDSAVGSLEGAGGKVLKVRATTIDTFLRDRGEIVPCLIKTDIEGHDIWALRGMQATVAKCQPLILTECGLSDDLTHLCSNWNYKMFAVVRNRETQRKKLRELSIRDSDRCYCKMIFLVPQALQSAFMELVEL